jgi:hypothetical protein
VYSTASSPAAACAASQAKAAERLGSGTAGLACGKTVTPLLRIDVAVIVASAPAEFPMWTRRAPLAAAPRAGPTTGPHSVSRMTS